MITDKVLYDISVVLGGQSIDYPGDTPYSRNLIMTAIVGKLMSPSQYYQAILACINKIYRYIFWRKSESEKNTDC